ncbi:MAG TPA: metal ABC transporter substrate-binding protein [Acidimicrobiales bacterium]
MGSTLGRMAAGALAAAALGVGAVACGSDSSSTGQASGTTTSRLADERLRIVTTVAPITSIAAAVIGDNADIRGIVPEGTNSHTFEPKPSDAEALETADVVFLNGLQLEQPTMELAEEVTPDGTPIIELADQTVTEDEWIYDFSFPKEEGKPNPHLWTNPSMAKRYAEIIRDQMTELDPDNEAEYEANTADFSNQVDEFDAALRTAFATIPAENRRLLTYHDAYAYFAQDYGFEVIGAIQPSTFDDPTPGEVADLISQVRETGVPAIFGSEVFPSPVLEQIGDEAGVRYVDVLRDDDLPEDPGDAEHSWYGLMRFDYRTITEALGGDPSALDALDTTPTVDDEATYPQ